MDRKLVILTHTKETKSRNYEEQPLWGFPLCGRASLKEVPHAHPYLGKLLFHAAVVATFLHPAVLFLIPVLKGEGVAAPSAFLVGFQPDVLDVVAVKVVFLGKLCDAGFDDLFDFGKILFHGGFLRVCFLCFVVCIFALKHTFIKSYRSHKCTKDKPQIRADNRVHYGS